MNTQKALEAFSLQLEFVAENPIDLQWKDRPNAVSNLISIFPIEYNGEATQDKLKRLEAFLDKEACYGIVLSSLDEIACK
jgi:Xaa-Pro aminopeptidase